MKSTVVTGIASVEMNASESKTDFATRNDISKKIVRKIDEFSLMSLCAAQKALVESNLDLQSINRERIGVYVGNMFGGWSFTSPQLRNLHQSGYQDVSPFQATAWFPAAAQGVISTELGIMGPTKTFVNGGASGIIALDRARSCILNDRADVMLVGASEAVHNEYLEGVFRRTFKNGLSSSNRSYFLILEDRLHAQKRKSSIMITLDEICYGGKNNSKTNEQFLFSYEGIARFLDHIKKIDKTIPWTFTYVSECSSKYEIKYSKG